MESTHKQKNILKGERSFFFFFENDHLKKGHKNKKSAVVEKA